MVLIRICKSLLCRLIVDISNSRPEQADFLHKTENSQIIQRVADDTSTLRATLDDQISHTGIRTIASHDDSTIDEKVFEWDNETVNAETYRRAMDHARLKVEMVPKAFEIDGKLDTISQSGREEMNGHVSPAGSPTGQRQKCLPYEVSVASEPLYGEQDYEVIPNSSISDRPFLRRSILSYRQKGGDAEKKSFWSTVSGRRSTRSSKQPERNTTAALGVSRVSTPGSRRGRRGFESSYHISIDFGSEDGLSALLIARAA